MQQPSSNCPDPATRIRPARVADAERMASLCGQLGYPLTPELARERIERLGASERDALLVAERMGAAAGWVHAAEQDLFEIGRRCEILGLVVDASCRRLGVGAQLLQAVEAWARQRGLTAISVRSAVPRAESHPFYAKYGYARIKSQHVYRKALD